MRAQMEQLEYAHTCFFTTEAAEALADDLVAHAPHGIGHVYLVSGGSEAIEAALKLARQYFVERGEPQRTKIRRPPARATTATRWARSRSAATRAAAPRSRRCCSSRITSTPATPTAIARQARREEAYGARAAAELEAKLIELGPETVIAFVAETVVGATARRRSPPRRATSRRSAKSATATACSSSSTR